MAISWQGERKGEKKYRLYREIAASACGLLAMTVVVGYRPKMYNRAQGRDTVIPVRKQGKSHSEFRHFMP